MARQTRSQRRARREAQAQSAEATAVDGASRRRPPRTPEPPARDLADRLPGGGFGRFVGESWAELKKVEWPKQPQVVQGTVVVLIACAIVGAYLWGADLILKRLVQNVLLH